MLSSALRLAAEDPVIQSAHLHVQTSNAAAITFYERHGFHRGAVLHKYYRKLDPPDAVELSRPLHAREVETHAEACQGYM